MRKMIEFLMVEDNPGDIRLSQEYLKDFQLSICLNVVRDHTQALQFLRGQGQYALATQPHVVLISIKELWKKEKRLLQQIKQDENLAHIPVVILSAFEGEEASLHADLADVLCISKPLNFDALVTIVSRIRHFGSTPAKAASSPKQNGLGPSLHEGNRSVIYHASQNPQEQLQTWENEGGMIR